MTLLTHWIQRSNDGDISKEEKQALKHTFAELDRLKKAAKGNEEAALLAFIKGQISVHVPFQLRALRSRFGDGTQKNLAESAVMKQPSISNLEKAGWNGVNTDTLARLAATMRVGLIVKFAPISEMIDWHASFYPDASIPTLDQEHAFAMHQLIANESATKIERTDSRPPTAIDFASRGRGKEALLSGDLGGRRSDLDRIYNEARQ